MNIILLDDEPLAMDILERRINELYDGAAIHKFTNIDIKKSSKLIQQTDLIFLDIHMPGKNGLELAEQLLEMNPTLSIVFVTAYDDYAVQAFELNALDYLLKPVQIERLQKTLERLGEPQHFLNKSTKNSEDKLYISVCGQLTIQLANKKKEIIPWRTVKAQELFLYLLQHSGKNIQKSELAELFWPDYVPDKAYAQLYTAIYHIRKVLHTYHDYLFIKNVQTGYALYMRNTKIDIKAWEDKLQAAPPIQLSTLHTYEAIMNLYTGDYLETYNYVWAEQEKFRLKQLWMQTAHSIANCYYENNDVEKAIEWYVKVCDASPEDENAAFQLMKIYADAGYGILVHYQYKKLKEALAELGLEISNKCTQWYQNWKLENHS